MLSQISDTRATPLIKEAEFILVEKKNRRNRIQGKIPSSYEEPVIMVFERAIQQPKLEVALTSDSDLNEFMKPRDRKGRYLNRFRVEAPADPVLTGRVLSIQKKGEVEAEESQEGISATRTEEVACVSDLISNKLHKTINPIIVSQEVSIEFVARNILFTQDSVSAFASDGMESNAITLDRLAARMFKNGFDRNYPLDIVEIEENKFTSIDNRRLLIAKRIKNFCSIYKIWVRIHGFREPLSKENVHRFSGALTWGEAVQRRVGDNSNGFKKYPIIRNNAGIFDARPKKNQRLSFPLSDDEMRRLSSQGYDRDLMNKYRSFSRTERMMMLTL